MQNKNKKTLRCTAWLQALCAAIAVVGAAGAQYGLYDKPYDLTGVGTGWTPRNSFLLRPNTGMEYRNFGWERYRERGIGFDWLPTYDQLGEPWIASSATVFSWIEDRTRAPDFSSSFSRSVGRHNGIVIARESFKNSVARVYVGDAVRTTFTSLTLDLSRFTGVRADAVIGQNHELTLLATRPSDPRLPIRLNVVGDVVRDQGTLLGGGHWEGRFLQGALFLGTTFVNHHRFDSLQENGNFLSGTMPAEMNPDTVAVRILDDSPLGGRRGAAIYGGRADATLRRAAQENRVVKDIQPLVVVSAGVRRVGDHWEVEDGEFVEHVVPVPSGTVGVHSSATVAQDYKIGMRQVHRAVDRAKVTEEVRRPPLETRLRSAGDGTETTQVVGFDYGLSSAMNVGGLNGKLALGGLEMEWEFARSSSHYQFPEEQIGTRSSYAGDAYYAHGVYDWRILTLGGEYFSISPKYNSYAFDSGNYRQGDLIATGRNDFITNDFMGNNFGFYFNEVQTNAFRTGNSKRNMIFPLVEDNDDDDQYKDQGQNDEPVLLRSQPLESGVYPGWDLDRDGVPDYNRNRNNIPDYLEPFFKYWQDEQVFYWGDDFNHNGVLDYFEDDSLPDYPYYKDERGSHLFVDWRTPLRGLSLRLGRFRIDQIAGTGHNHVDYLASTYRRVIPGKARLQWEHEIKWIEDDIPNHTFQYLLDEDKVDVEGGYKSVFVIDGLEMRNSTVNRGYVGTHWSPLRGLNLVNNIRYELNGKQQAQFADGTSQETEELNTWAMVNKADYTGVWRRFRLQPMFKHILLKQDLQGGAGPGGIGRRRNITEIIPIFLGGYEFTDRTSLEFGVEGLPFFAERFIDRENEALDFKAQTYLAQIKMKGNSGGFNVFIITGVQYTKKKFDEPELPSGSFVRSFFQVFVGEQILAASE